MDDIAADDSFSYLPSFFFPLLFFLFNFLISSSFLLSLSLTIFITVITLLFQHIMTDLDIL